MWPFDKQPEPAAIIGAGTASGMHGHPVVMPSDQELILAETREVNATLKAILALLDERLPKP